MRGDKNSMSVSSMDQSFLRVKNRCSPVWMHGQTGGYNRDPVARIARIILCCRC